MNRKLKKAILLCEKAESKNGYKNIKSDELKTLLDAAKTFALLQDSKNNPWMPLPEEFLGWFSFLWNAYAITPDNELAVDAQIFKRQMLEIASRGKEKK